MNKYLSLSYMLKHFDEKREDLAPYGLTCEVWRPNVMRRADRHNEIEINYLPEGSITYLIHDKKIHVEKGSFVVFWALLPHQIVDYEGDAPYFVITIPFGLISQWNMSKSFLDLLFKGRIQMFETVQNLQITTALFKQWVLDLESKLSYLNEVCALEIQAYLKRLMFQKSNNDEIELKMELPPMNLVEQMAIFIAQNFTKPIKVTDVSSAVGIHSDYANAIFKKAFDVSLSHYLIQQRVLYVQRKLTITMDPITSIAYEAGFNSISRFNASFLKFVGMTPREYRKIIQSDI
ncbi:helix-turn-helix domain-containing protein [Arenibacter sp. S6351L]|uniref:helix-turn-helix domain-containing protein n=1 Tax=Arenibacter sp. S6351L TaxID=2926407 RepID=UPI001FF5E86D|nr:helix-turn-helix domain-containing protein [Arenibacter sp. S6351L]MCK0135957.1 helix-turn-helix domain-containing protein [Arenibacter sp. S6351L]